MLELNHIHKYYNAGTVNEMCLFHDFSLSIEDGQFVSVAIGHCRQTFFFNLQDRFSFKLAY